MYLVNLNSQWCRVAQLLGRDADAATAAARVVPNFAALARLSADDRAVVWASLPTASRDLKVGETLLADPKLKAQRALVLFRLDRFADAEAAADDSPAGLFVRSACRAKRGDAAGAKVDLAAASAKLDALPLRDLELVLLQREAASGIR